MGSQALARYPMDKAVYRARVEEEVVMKEDFFR